MPKSLPKRFQNCSKIGPKSFQNRCHTHPRRSRDAWRPTKTAQIVSKDLSSLPGIHFGTVLEPILLLKIARRRTKINSKPASAPQQTDRKTDRQTDKQTNRQTYRQASRQTYRQTKQTNIHIDARDHTTRITTPTNHLPPDWNANTKTSKANSNTIQMHSGTCRMISRKSEHGPTQNNKPRNFEGRRQWRQPIN